MIPYYGGRQTTNTENDHRARIGARFKALVDGGMTVREAWVKSHSDFGTDVNTGEYTGESDVVATATEVAAVASPPPAPPPPPRSPLPPELDLTSDINDTLRSEM